MPRPILTAAASALLIVALVALGAPAAPRVQADQVLQSAPDLTGFNVYFSESLGEASRFDRSEAGMSRLGGLLELLGANLYTLEWRTGIPESADLLVIAGPTADMADNQVAWLWAYLQNGGRLLLLSDPLYYNPNGTVEISKALGATKGLYPLMWADMGLRARDDLAATQGEGVMVVPPPAQVGRDQPTPTPAPAVEVPALVTTYTASTFAAHPITAGLEGSLKFFGARSLDVDSAPRQSQVTPLVFSDNGFYGEMDRATYLTYHFAEYNPAQDIPRGELTLAAAMQDTLSGARIVVIGDREFATNGGGLQSSPPYSGSFLYPDNISFLLNVFGWLLGAEGSVQGFEFPTPGPTVTPTPTLTPTPVLPPTPTPTAAP